MNKYLGFYELKSSRLPSANWEIFNEGTLLDSNNLWTLRVAVENSLDLNLPRYVGINASEAIVRGKELLKQYGKCGIVIYYPFFIAEKSGVLEVALNNIIIEAVDNDLWNLVTHGRKNVTYQISDHILVTGDESFLSKNEIEELQKYAKIIKGRYRNTIIEGSSIFAEWSYAYNSNTKHEPIGDRYLIFYELRSVK